VVCATFHSSNVSRPATAVALFAFVSTVEGIELAKRLANRGLRLNHP